MVCSARRSPLVGFAVVAALASGCALAHASAASRGMRVTRADRPVATVAVSGLRALHVAGREVLVDIPRQLRHPAPLVVALGGIGWSAHADVVKFRLGPSAERSGAVVAYPDPHDGIWNAGSCCWGARSNDIGLLTQLRMTIERMVPIDPRREILIGFSNGGMLAYAAACADGHWTAIIAYGATLSSRCRPANPFFITNVNGTADNVVPWTGGWSGYARAEMPPVWKIDYEFAGVFGCRRSSASHGAGNFVYLYFDCRDGVVIRDIRVINLGHHWSTTQQDGFDMGPALWRLTGL
jgi:polyhydroxybutyrate depolymerase